MCSFILKAFPLHTSFCDFLSRVSWRREPLQAWECIMWKQTMFDVTSLVWRYTIILWSFITGSYKHNEISDKPKRTLSIMSEKYSSYNQCIGNKERITFDQNLHRMVNSLLQPVPTTAIHREIRDTAYMVSNVKELVDVLWDLLNRLF